MMMYLPVLVMVVGVVVFLGCQKNNDVKALGKDAFWVGLFVALLVFAREHVKFP